MAFGFSEAQNMSRREMHSLCQKDLAPWANERAKMDYIPHRERIRTTMPFSDGLVG